MSASRWPSLVGRRLFLRVFAHGVVLLALSALVAIPLYGQLVERPAAREVGRIADVLGAEACARLLRPAERGELRRMPVRVSVYTAGDVLAFSSEAPALPPLPADRRAELAARGAVRVERGLDAYRCAGAPRGEYVVLGRPRFGLSTGRLALLLGVVLLGAALASVPLARSIAAPLEEVVEVTRAFGRGALSARARVGRRDDIGDLAAAFNDMAARLETSIRAEKEMLASVSHELRTPLARIRVVLETARESPARAQRLLGEIAHDLKDLERLVEDVMAAVRLDLGGVSRDDAALRVRREPTDLTALLAASAERFRLAHPDRALDVDVEDGLPRAPADARLLRRLVDNLLDNAAKYSEPDDPVHLRASHRDGAVCVDVEDHGEGIRPEDLPHVFEPFFRADRSRSRATGGAGLGLALAKRIADVHGAPLTIRSAVDEGTTVTLALPLVETI